jgi:MoxR-like ATPase
MALSDDAIRHLLEWFATSSQTNKEWSPKRKAAEVENHKWIQPAVIQSLTDDELAKKFIDYYNSDTGFKQNIIKISRDRIVRDKNIFRITLTYLFDEGVNIKDRLDRILDGEYRIKGFAKSIVTAFLMDYKPGEYCLWNNKVESGFKTLGWPFRQRGDSPGMIYQRILEGAKKLKNLRPDLNLTLNDIDLFLHTVAAEDEGKEAIRSLTGETINEEGRYWQIAPGEQARLWNDLRANSIVAVGWAPLNLDLTGRSKEELSDLYKQYYPEETPTQIRIGVGMLWNFLNLKPGDRFVTNKGRSLLLGLGSITGTYKFKPERAEYKHTIEVNYDKVSETGVSIPAKYRGKFGKTITPLTKAEFKDMEKLFGPEIIDFDKLQKVIESYAKPKWEAVESEEWPWRNGGGEVYLQEDILKKASPHLTEEALREEAKESLYIALKADVNLLSQYEWMYAKTFIQEVPEEELRDHISALLYSPEELGIRLRRFLDWAKVVPIPERNAKKGINATVTSFFLAMSNPRRYAFCKPVAYSSAVSELMGKSAVREDPVERVIHCQEFYLEVLQFLEDEYGLEDGNLLDVSSMFFCFQDKDKDGLTAWDRIKEPGRIELTEEQSSDNPIFELLMEKHNVVLYGPPGTGKTREALLLGNWWKTRYGADTVRQITFHPSYCYEDFIEGYRPTSDGSGFQLKPGIFKNVCQKAGSDSSKRYLLIIDEINRGDVARILGELITLIEGDKRGPSYSATLQQSGDPFYVPRNLYVLGTMNTADKSISLMDLAIRRRFLFQYFPPNPDVLDEAKGFLSEVAGIRLSSLLIGLNQKLMDIGVDRDRVLGHSFLLISKEVLNPLATLKKRFQYEIIPLVEEYCYADRASMSRVLGDLVEANGLINVDVLDDEERFLSALKDLSYLE